MCFFKSKPPCFPDLPHCGRDLMHPHVFMALTMALAGALATACGHNVQCI